MIIPLLFIAIKNRETFEERPFKITKIAIPFAVIALNYVFDVIELVSEDMDIIGIATADFLRFIVTCLVSLLVIVFGGMLVYQGVKEIKILTINLGLLTAFIQFFGFYSSVGDNNIFIFGALLVVFGVVIIFINWKMLSIKKSRQEQLNGGGTDA